MTNAAPAKPWPLFEIEVWTGREYQVCTRTARSRSAARFDVFRSYSECWDVSFRDFLRVCRVRTITARLNASADGYQYVRSAYGVDPTIGQRVTLKNEGPSSGKQGTVLYPNKASTAYVHVILDGEKHPVVVHPLNVELHPVEVAAADARSRPDTTPGHSAAAAGDSWPAPY